MFMHMYRIPGGGGGQNYDEYIFITELRQATLSCYSYYISIIFVCEINVMFMCFTGDAVEAGKYPYLYFSKFYMGCIMR